MPVGYPVSLGQDNALTAGDIIGGGGATSFAAQSALGTGQWTWSGTRAGTTHVNSTEAGRYYLATDGGVYFVPDAGTEELTGLSGVMGIDIADGVHSYTFEVAFAPEED